MMSPDSSTALRSALTPVLAAAPHRIAMVALTVRDLDRVAAFYQSVIGLDVVQQQEGRVALGTGQVALIELRADPAALQRSSRDAGLFHTAFLLPGRADLGAWLAYATRQGVALQGASDHLVSEAIYLCDPEGNGIEIYVDRPPEAWTRQGGAIVMATDPLDAAGLLKAGSEREWSGFPDGGVVGHVHLQVGALAPAEAFYRDLLGFDLTCQYPGGSFFGSGGYHHQLAANIWNSRGASVRPEPSTGLANVEILVDAAMLGAIRGRLDAAGSQTAGDWPLSLRDPWGTTITLSVS